MGISLKDENGEISEEFINICQKFEDNLNENMREWVVSKFKSKDPRIVFKREAICDSAFLLKGKYYVLHILNDEGNKCDKFKYRGVDVVKATMPRALKPYVKDIIETMVMTKDKDKTNRKFLDAYEVYKKLGPESIYVISTINNYNEWIPKCDKLNTAKKMPHHLKAALAHDYLVDELGLVSKYPKFQNGDKIKMVELKTPNKYGISKIGYKGKWPEEFDQIFTIDFEKMFGKIMYAAIERFFAVVGWVLRKPNENLKVELEDFLS
jgi:ribosome-associated toxin RatA of RatAB toxin-antitoxin module